MMLRRVVACAMVCAAVLLLTPRGSADELLITAGSSWRYNDTGADLGTAWQAPGFNDAAWPSGLAQLGYGDGDEVTLVGFGGDTANKFITTYFRRSFTAAPASISALVLRVLRDDGCVIYINGLEVARSNMPTGAVTSTTPATTAIGGTDETTWIEIPLAPSVLVAGNNVIAVELHQQSPTSTDISFDLELRAVPIAAPSVSVSLTSPANHAVVNNTTVTLTASASAPAGLSTATLQVGGSPRTAIFTGAGQIEDTQITADTPTVPAGDATSITVDGLTPHAHGLVRFPALVGSAAGQVPAGSIVTSAIFRVNCTNPGMTLQLYRLTQGWVEDQATWNERAAGVAWTSPGADGAGSNAGVAVAGDCTVAGQRDIDITRFVQEWADGLPNFGLVMIDSGTDGVAFASSESATSPVLTVTFKDPLVPVQTQVLTGTDAQVSFTVNLSLGLTYFWNVEVRDANGTVQRAAADFDVTVDAAVPNLPVLVSPADGATGVSLAASLIATVTDPGGGPLTAGVQIRKASAPEFTIIVMPDTQFYSESFPSIFTTQTQWIVNQKQSRNIVFVTHEGDIVNVNTDATQWQRANTSMSLLDGVVPYGMGPGNHDQPTTLYNQTFPFTRYQNQPWYGGHYQNLNDNNFQLFSGGGMDFVIVHLEFCPPADAVAWARSVYAAYPDRIGIMTTHGYLNESAQRTVHGCTNTQYLWDDLALPSPNLHFMFSGHVHDESRRMDTANGHPVFQILADYQARASGGEGWLRIMRFVPSEDKIYVQTYSPWLDRFETDANSEFTLDFPMSAPFANAGAVNVQSGSNAAIAPAGLLPATEYEWQMTVTNSGGRSRVGPTWTFTTAGGGPVNAAPTVATPAAAAPNPVIGTTTTLSVLGADDAGEAGLTYSWATTGTPPAAVTFGANGTNAAKTTTATFTTTGSYTFQVTIRDAGNLTVTSTVNVTVNPVAPPVTVGYVQGASVTFPGDTVATNIARAFTSANAAGNLIVVALTWDGTATVSCADSQANTYALAATHYDTTNAQSLAICYAANIKAGPNTVTATFSASSSWRRMLIHEYRGLAMVSPVDVVAKNVANATTAANAVTSTAATTTVAGDLIFGAVMDDSGPTTITAGTGFTQRLSVNNMDLASEDLVQPAAGSIAATHTFATANRYLAIMVAFRPGGPANAAPTVATPAAATPAPVLGTTTTLSALGADDSGEAGLTYTWATTGTPLAPVTFSANGTNAAKTTTATFTKAGSYTFQVTMRDGGNLTVTSTVAVTVNQTLTTILVSPSGVSVPANGSQAFGATARDQFATALTSPPAFIWSVDAGGVINTAGLFTAGATAGGPFTVTATSGTVTGIATVTVTPVNLAPSVATPAAAAPNPAIGTTTTLSALGADDAGESALTYTWATTGTPPAAVTFSANGTNAAKTTTATFTRAGSYTFQVTIRDGGNLTVTSNVGVTVTQTVTAITVTPASASVVTSATQSFSGNAVDQFGQALAPQPAFTWSVNGGGTISAAGLFTAGATAGGPFTVTAATAGKTGTASVTVTAPPQGPGITYVQGATMTISGGTSGINIARAFTTANTAGNLIVVAVTWDGTASVSCADTQGNAYSIATSTFDSTNSQSLAICYAANVKAGANTVTATFSGTSSWRRMLIHEYSGVALVNPVDVVAANVANGTTAANVITSTAAVTTASGNLIFGAVMDDDGTTNVTAGTGFTQRLSVNNKDLASEDLIQASAGAIAATHTFGASHRYLALMVAFKRQ